MTDLTRVFPVNQRRWLFSLGRKKITVMTPSSSLWSLRSTLTPPLHWSTKTKKKLGKIISTVYLPPRPKQSIIPLSLSTPSLSLSLKACRNRIEEECRGFRERERSKARDFEGTMLRHSLVVFLTFCLALRLSYSRRG